MFQPTLIWMNLVALISSSLLSNGGTAWRATNSYFVNHETWKTQLPSQATRPTQGPGVGKEHPEAHLGIWKVWTGVDLALVPLPTGQIYMIQHQFLSFSQFVQTNPSTSVTSVSSAKKSMHRSDHSTEAVDILPSHLSACKAFCVQSLLLQPVWEVVGWRPTNQHLPGISIRCFSGQGRVHSSDSSGFKVPDRYVDRWMDGYMDMRINGHMDN